MVSPVAYEYYRDDMVTLYCGDCRELVPALGIRADAVIADPPYAETSLEWDVWPQGWPAIMRGVTASMWCFGSLRMFWTYRDEFDGWAMAQDIIWEKHNGTNMANDRFRRVHEMIVQFYMGKWSEIYKAPIYTQDATRRTVRLKMRPDHWGKIGNGAYTSEDGGPRLQRSVIQVRSAHGDAIHPTQKPAGIIRPLLRYSVPAGGIVVDPFAGSGVVLSVAKSEGMRAIGIEARETYCASAVNLLRQMPLISTTSDNDLLSAGGEAGNE